jgi:GNAT superfamily N-acetyltransferase
MDQNELALRRTQMGWVCAALAAGPDMEYQVEAGWWLGLTAAPSPDVNMALLHERDGSALAEIVRRIADRGCPAFVMLAGDALSLAGELPDGWEQVGTTPMMAVDLATTPTAPDPRVRRAGPQDVGSLTDLLAESYGMSREIAAVAMGPVARGETGLVVWLLEEDGQAVSTVSASRIEDSVCVSMMGTPVRFGRRGHGRALLAAVLDDARIDGAKIGLLNASPAAISLYQSIGWSTVDDWAVFTDVTSA